MRPHRPSSTFSVSSIATDSLAKSGIHRKVSEIIEHWRSSQPGDSRQVLAEHSELAGDRSLALDLIYEEFCLRRESGEVVDVERFCERFPAFRSAVERMIDVHNVLEQNPDLIACPEQAWPAVGETYRGYEILEELGRGTLATVFLAREHALGGRLVVIKIADAGEYEAATLGRLLHPNIVRIHSVQTDTGSRRSIICMAFQGRGTLADVLDRIFAEPFPPRLADALLRASQAMSRPDEPVEHDKPDAFLRRASYASGVAHIAAQLADALAYTHATGVCHRDLKPSNILLTPGGCPMLIDFNLSSDQRASIRIGGTLPYMAPEQIESALRLQSGDAPLDHRADLFSLGVVVYQMLCREAPFPLAAGSRSLQDAARALVESQRSGPVPIRSRFPSVDRELASLIERCLRFSPDDRPSSAGELAERLRQCLTVRRRVLRWMDTRRIRVGLAAACMLGVGIAGATALAMREPFAIREFNRSLQLIKDRDYDPALESLNQILTIQPAFAEAHVARGDLFRALHDYAPAVADYEWALALKKDARVESLRGFCYTRLNLPKLAVAAYELARSQGFETAGSANNLGFNLLRLNQLAKARECFFRAIQLDDQLQAAYHNRAMLDYQTNANASNGMPQAGIRDIQQAMQIGPLSGELCFDAAKLYALAARTDPAWGDSGIDALERAIDLGLKFEVVDREPAFESLQSHSKYANLRSRARGPVQAYPAAFVVAPD
jgi:serine/threonine protein kinase/Tfp pilus assembly protein PilF